MDPFRPASPPEARPLAASTCNPAPNCSGFRPREAFLSPLWRLVSDHLDAFLRNYSERHLFTHGPLASHVEKVWNDFLKCGDYNQGLVLLKCPGCGTSLAVPYSCKTRICPSCMTRRAEDLAVTLGDILPRVPYRHVVITFPRLMGIRHRVREDPTLLRRLVRLSVGVVTRELRREVRAHRHRREELAAALPGVVAACQSAGDCLQYHPHIHALITDGVFLPSGDFYGYLDWDSGRLTGLLRDSVLASFTRLGLLSPEAADTMKSWPVERSGFHVHVETRVDPDDREHLRTLLKYLTRSPIALDRLNYSEQTGQVTYRTKKGATLHTLERGRTGRVDLRRRCFARNAAASAPDSGPVPPLWVPWTFWPTCLSMSPREGAPSCRTTAGSPAPWADWSDEASPSPKGLPPHPHPGDAVPGPGSSSASGRWTRRSALGAGPRCVAVGPCWSGTS